MIVVKITEQPREHDPRVLLCFSAFTEALETLNAAITAGYYCQISMEGGEWHGKGSCISPL